MFPVDDLESVSSTQAETPEVKRQRRLNLPNFEVPNYLHCEATPARSSPNRLSLPLLLVKLGINSQFKLETLFCPIPEDLLNSRQRLPVNLPGAEKTGVLDA